MHLLSITFDCTLNTDVIEVGKVAACVPNNSHHKAGEAQSIYYITHMFYLLPLHQKFHDRSITLAECEMSSDIHICL